MSNPTGIDRPRWVDWSKHQGIVNPDVSKANGVLGTAIRAAISYAYTDPFFHTNYQGAGDVEIYRTSYHVLYPDQSVIKQADNWYRVHPEIDIIPRVIDLELDRGQPWSRIAVVAGQMSEVVLTRDGVRPIIYSRYRLVNEWLQSWTEDMLNDHYWWLAQYSWFGFREHAGPPTLPKRLRRDRVILHQTSDHKLAPPGEVQSKSVDWDRWEKGNQDEMELFIAGVWGGGSPPPPPPPVTYAVRIKVNLNVRDEPEGKDIGTLRQGTDVTVVDQSGEWLKLAEGWIHGGYTEKVE